MDASQIAGKSTGAARARRHAGLHSQASRARFWCFEITLLPTAVCWRAQPACRCAPAAAGARRLSPLDSCRQPLSLHFPEAQVD